MGPQPLGSCNAVVILSLRRLFYLPLHITQLFSPHRATGHAFPAWPEYFLALRACTCARTFVMPPGTPPLHSTTATSYSHAVPFACRHFAFSAVAHFVPSAHTAVVRLLPRLIVLCRTFVTLALMYRTVLFIPRCSPHPGARWNRTDDTRRSCCGTRYAYPLILLIHTRSSVVFQHGNRPVTLLFSSVHWFTVPRRFLVLPFLPLYGACTACPRYLHHRVCYCSRTLPAFYLPSCTCLLFVCAFCVCTFTCHTCFLACLIFKHLPRHLVVVDVLSFFFCLHAGIYL